MDETRIVGDLPSLRMEIVHRQDADGGAEHMTIHLTATPSFQAAKSLMLANPWGLWSDMAQAMMAPMMAPWGGFAALNPWLPKAKDHTPKLW